MRGWPCGKLGYVAHQSNFMNEQREHSEPLSPQSEGKKEHLFEGNRRAVAGMIYQYWTGIPRLNLLE
jgi:hypothetical protein